MISIPLFYACLLVIAVGGIIIMAWMMTLQYYRDSRVRDALALKVADEAALVADRVTTEAGAIADALHTQENRSKTSRANIEDVLEIVRDIHKRVITNGDSSI